MPSSVSASIMLSVISISSHLGSSRDSARACSTEGTKSLLWNWGAAMLTLTRNGGTPASCQALFCRQAVDSAHLPMAVIRPLDSATEMNSPG